MIMTDPFVERWLHPCPTAEYIVQALCTVGVVVIGKLWMKWKIAKAEREAESDEPAREGESSRVKGPCPVIVRRQ